MRRPERHQLQVPAVGGDRARHARERVRGRRDRVRPPDRGEGDDRGGQGQRRHAGERRAHPADARGAGGGVIPRRPGAGIPQAKEGSLYDEKILHHVQANRPDREPVGTRGMGIHPCRPGVEALQGPEGASNQNRPLRKKEHRDPVPVRYWISDPGHGQACPPGPLVFDTQKSR